MEIRQAKCYLENYPRPQFVRGEWKSLDGKWNFAFDYQNEGEEKGYFSGFEPQHEITVPYSFECEASGIGIEKPCDVVWYSRTLEITKEQLKKSCILNFDGVDYTAKVWLNGRFLGKHSGGYTRFSFDIANCAKEGDNLLVVKAEDGDEADKPRGKQRWMPYNYGCWYVQTTGIWKSVWLEFADRRGRILNAKITPRTDEYSFDIEFETLLNGSGRYEIETKIEFRGKSICSARTELDGEVLKQKMFIESRLIDNQVYFWSPNDPAVYDFTFTLYKDGEIVDKIGSYCGFRDFRAEEGKVLLNGFPFYQKSVLYQGYFAQSGITPPSEEKIIEDILLMKKAGFNGARLHQIVETDLFLYYADILGLTVWCELPSPHTFNGRACENVAREWHDVVKQVYNHSAVVTWVIYNESWGIREVSYNRTQQLFTESLYYFTKAYDHMRPVIANDGWEHTLCDVLTIHNYEQNANLFKDLYKNVEELQRKYQDAPPHLPFAKGYSYGGQPIIFSEYGGCAFSEDTKNGWGYGNAVSDEESFFERFGALMRVIKSLDYCAGYCYTQFTDVQQEKNGLFTIDRRCKVDIARLRAANEEDI